MDSRETEQLERRLRQASLESSPATSAAQRAVREQTAVRRMRTWIVVAATAVVVLALAGYVIFGTSGYADLARDHKREVIEQRPRRWRTEPAEVATLSARYGVTDAMISDLAPAGFRLQHAKTCAMSGKPALHLVYTDGTKVFSLYLRQSAGSESKPALRKVNSEQIAAFHHDGFEAAVVMEGSGTQCLEWARRAASIL
jgi:hypothetical protein